MSLFRWRLLIAVSLLLLNYQALFAASSAEIVNQRHFIYLPLLQHQTDNGNPQEQPQTVEKLPCDLNEQEQSLATLFAGAPEQKRVGPVCDSVLAQVARARAEDMAARHYFGHVNPDGMGANYLVVQAGYPLPSSYNHAVDANSIESIAGGFDSADKVWNGWMSSAGHREHLLGLQYFYASQIEYGIGYAYDVESPYHCYWVVITARPAS